MLTGREVIEAARRMTPDETRAQIAAAEFICRRGCSCPGIPSKGVKNAQTKRQA